MGSIPKNIKKLRLQKKLTQEDMAGKLFVTRQTVSNWETGKSQPDIDTLIKIAETLNSDVTVLIYGLPDANNRKKEIKRFIIVAGILLILGIAICILDPIAKKEFAEHFSNELMMILRTYIEPLFWFVAGWTVVQGLVLLGVIKPVRAKYGKVIRIAVLAIVLLYAAAMLPYLITIIQLSFMKSQNTGGYSIEFNFPQFLTNFYFFVFDTIAKWPVIFVIPGLVFRFFRPVKGEAGNAVKSH